MSLFLTRSANNKHGHADPARRAAGGRSALHTSRFRGSAAGAGICGRRGATYSFNEIAA